jgi:hypothetical protein
VLQWQLLRYKYATGCGHSGLKHLRPTGRQQSGGVRGRESTYKYHTKPTSKMKLNIPQALKLRWKERATESEKKLEQ